MRRKFGRNRHFDIGMRLVRDAAGRDSHPLDSERERHRLVRIVRGEYGPVASSRELYHKLLLNVNAEMK